MLRQWSRCVVGVESAYATSTRARMSLLGAQQERTAPEIPRLRGRRELSHTRDTFGGEKRRTNKRFVTGALVAIALIGVGWTADSMLERTPSGTWMRRVPRAQTAHMANIQLEGLMKMIERKRMRRKPSEYTQRGGRSGGTERMERRSDYPDIESTEGLHSLVYDCKHCEEALERVSRRVTASVLEGIPRRRHADFRWRFKLLVDDEPLAIALPDGTVLVSTATLEKVASDDELAAVLAHECAHVVCRHAVLMARLVARMDRQHRSSPEVEQAQRQLAIRCELEADREGLRVMQRAGYDCTAALAMLEKTRDSPQGFSTHPSRDERLQQLHTILEQRR